TGLDLFERLVDKWYKAGHRVICIDPLRVLEAALGIATYPGNEITANVWTEDFNTTRYYTRLAQKYHDLCFLISLHHGKNKQGQNKQDPQDMVVGTTGLGAGMVT